MTETFFAAVNYGAYPAAQTGIGLGSAIAVVVHGTGTVPSFGPFSPEFSPGFMCFTSRSPENQTNCRVDQSLKVTFFQNP